MSGKSFRYGLIVFCCLICVFGAAPKLFATAPCPNGVLASSCPMENKADFVECFRITIDNVAQGAIQVSEDRGKSFENIGRVLVPVSQVNASGFTAAKWVNDWEVAATAVNAIHIKVHNNKKDGRGMVFSLLPKDFAKVPENYNSFYCPQTSLLCDIVAGDLIFGGKYSPFVGSRVAVVNLSRATGEAEGDFVPRLGDQFIIIVEQPRCYPRQAVFENRFGGKVTLTFINGEEKVVGEVLKPVLGIGRFPGTKYTDVGRIRANHAAVIDISTSPRGKVGGFQIIPAGHGMDEEMRKARTETQWMVIGPPQVGGPSLEGTAPLFKYFIRPVYFENVLESEDWRALMLGRTLVEVKVTGKDGWQPMPRGVVDEDQPLPEWANEALSKVTDIRILFPLTDGATN